LSLVFTLLFQFSEPQYVLWYNYIIEWILSVFFYFTQIIEHLKLLNTYCSYNTLRKHYANTFRLVWQYCLILWKLVSNRILFVNFGKIFVALKSISKNLFIYWNFIVYKLIRNDWSRKWIYWCESLTKSVSHWLLWMA
jgi:hypothetical protein